MKKVTAIVFGLGLLSQFFLLNAEPVMDLRNCAKVDSDLKRLACFDEAVKGLSGEVTITIPSEGATPVVPLVAPLAISSESTIKTKVAAKPKDTFGLQNKLANEEPEEIHSTIPGEFKGWSGKTVFKLENGQVWKQVDPGRKVVFKATNPKVTIKKAVFGSYRLKIEGLNSTLAVRRIK